MENLSQKEQNIILVLIESEKPLQSSEIHLALKKAKQDVSLVTVKRALSEMTAKKLVAVSGSGRATNYGIAAAGRVFADIDAAAYCQIEPDKRYGMAGYNFDLFDNFPAKIFYTDEAETLKSAQKNYEQKTTSTSQTIRKKELERFVIELSWKSSKIEGNTYTLLETEKLILENQKAAGRTENETKMILNHKKAFDLIWQNPNEFETFDRATIERIHARLTQDMQIAPGLRKSPVGITGTKYRPLDNIYQIQDAINALGKAIQKIKSPAAKAMLAILGISYIQPFEDGNKRTGRMTANALLLAHKNPPLSYRSVDENEYRQAIIAFYELNSIAPFKKIFLDQYAFAAQNYAIK